MTLRAAHAVFAGLAILAGGRGAHAQDANATPQIAIDYAEPISPGFDFRLRFKSVPGSSFGLIISAPVGGSTDPLALSNAELASAVIIPLVETTPGELTIQGYTPIDVSLESLRAAGVRLRLAIGNNLTGGIQISEAIPLVATPAVTTGSGADVSASTATGDTATQSQSSSSNSPEVANPNATSGLSTTSSVAASVSASSSASTSTSSGSDGEVAAIMSSSGATSTGATSTGGYGSGGGTSSTTSAGSFGNGIGKPALSPWSLNSQLVRLISQNTSFSSHDQPAPIQGSGH